MAETSTTEPVLVSPDTLDLEGAVSLVDSALPEEAEANAAFVSGDHWQKGEGWTGPAPDQEDADYDVTIGLIEEAFTSRNVIREIVQRRVRGVIGREPRFGVVPREVTEPGTELTEEQKRARLEIEAALTEWWDRRKVHKALERAVSHACWATRGPLRVYIPEAYAANGVVRRQPNLESALRLIHVEAPEPSLATVVEDSDTRDEVGILVTERNGEKVAEVCYLTGEVDAARRTVFATLHDEKIAGEGKGRESFELDLGGRITMAAIESDLLITQQQQQMQRALNLCLTMVSHNIVTGGFLERIILNGLPPGHWETDANGKRTRFVREPFVTGAGSTAWISGFEVPAPDGSTVVTSPSVAWRPPTDPDFANKAKRSIYQDMLEEADQAHVLITSDATASGISRQQARGDFEMSLTQLEGPTNAVGRWLVEIVLALAEAIMAKPGSILDEWRGQFECRVTPAPLSIDERQQAVTEMKDRLRARETTMEAVGVLDVAAEDARIAADPDAALSDLTRRAIVVQHLSAAGADVVAAARVAGIEEPEQLMPTDVPGPDDDPDDDPDDEPPPNEGSGGT